MMVPHTLRALGASRTPLAAAARGLGGMACDGPRGAPPCPPCLPRPPPPCRARDPHPPRGLRIVCCPPLPDKPPPCKPTPCSMTCKNITPKRQCKPARMQKRDLPQGKLAVGGQDFVARRLQWAQRIRQLDYEREVAQRTDAPPPPREPPPAPYVLGAEREVLRATDGRNYGLTRTSAHRARCSSTGIPPPPLAVTVEKLDHTCQPGEQHPDPCAHQPRVFIEIDRSATATSTLPKVTGTNKASTSFQASKSSHGNSNPAACHHTSSVGSKRSESSACKASCPRSTRSGGRRIGDLGWCANPLSSPDTPQRCRPVTIVERLRSRSSRSAPRGIRPGNERRLHTLTISRSATNGLQAVLDSREQLMEAGRGRVVSDTCSPLARQSPRAASPAGKLELNVRPGTSKIRVNVFLDDSDDACNTTPARTTEASCGTESCKNSIQCKPNDSWLSIKKIQDKITGCPTMKTSGTENKVPEKPRSPPSYHRTECPPPPLRPRCPGSPPAPTNKGLPTSPCDKPKQFSSISFLIRNFV